jgi:hypothetical protein
MSEEMQLALEHTLKTMRELKEAKAEIERLRALLKEVDDWVRDLEPFADAGHEPVTVFKKVRAALAEEKKDDR